MGYVPPTLEEWKSIKKLEAWNLRRRHLRYLGLVISLVVGIGIAIFLALGN